MIALWDNKMQVKKYLRTALLLLAAGLLIAGTVRHKAAYQPQQATITPERRATHMITYYEDSASGNSVRSGLCTGTAVGPHALLTALHCDEGQSDTVSLDLAVRKYKIIGHIYDGQDHIIYHLDGPAFTQFVTIKEREAVLGEAVTSYGDGEGEYPQHSYYGKVVVDENGGDTSEIDIAAGAHVFTLPAVPGDSGSAVYGKDGDIVALVTYGDKNEQTDKSQAVGFALAFTPQELEEIKE